ncbi:unnamed protein product [Prorocentrum cordatum]|uniref:Uncharacterized protein n=1 Tax=Prorocentrum cordatum TaxID=2364126 RepID=A0ABN9ULB4_9DINO|nr:unnamed protein product [Polarella glacialis]
MYDLAREEVDSLRLVRIFCDVKKETGKIGKAPVWNYKKCSVVRAEYTRHDMRNKDYPSPRAAAAFRSSDIAANLEQNLEQLTIDPPSHMEQDMGTPLPELRRAECQEGQLASTQGAVRINSARARGHPRYWHSACVNSPLGTADNVEGLRDLTAEQQQVGAPFLDTSAPAAAPPAAPPAPADRGSAPVPRAAAVAEDTAGDLENHASLAGLQQLRHLERWSGSPPEALGRLYNSTEALQDVPGSLKLAVGKARGASAQAVLNATTDETKLGAWKCFLAFDRMIFGELFEEGRVLSRSVAERVAGRLRYFWDGRWEALLWDTAVSTKAAAGSNTMGTTVREVRRLLLKGEISRAASAAWGPGRWAVAADALQAFGQQQKPPTRAQAYLTNKWTKTVRGAGAEVQGDRFEHWQPLAHLEALGAATTAMPSLLLGGAVPAEALDVALAGKLSGTAKNHGGTAECTVRYDSIRRAVSELQVGVAVPCGLGALHKSISSDAEQCPDLAFVSLDLSAFTRLRRRAVLRRVRERCPDLEGLVVQWYSRATVHSAAEAGEVSHLVEQQEGLDQRCPISPALFSIALAPELYALRDFLRTLDLAARRGLTWATPT